MIVIIHISVIIIIIITISIIIIIINGTMDNLAPVSYVKIVPGMPR